MSVLFSRLANNESHLESVIEPEPMKHFEFNGTLFVDEYYIHTNDEFDQYLLEGIQCAHIGLECDNASIVVESLSDVMHNVIQWFKKWLIKFKNFIVKCIKQIWNFFTKGEEIVRRFEGKYVDFKPFTVKGYNYTISPNDLNYQLYSDFINSVNAAAYDVAYADTEASLNAAVSRTKGAFSSPVFLDMFRGKMLKCSAVNNKDFKKNLKRSLRNGDLDKIDIEVNPSSIQGMCVKFKTFKENIEFCKRNKKLMEDHTEGLIAWLESGTHRIRVNGKFTKELRRKQVSAIYNIYSEAALTAKQLQHVYDTYYMTKLDVLNEAIVFYTRVFRTAFVEGKAKV